MEKMVNRILLNYKKHLSIDENKEAILRYSLHLVISSITGFGLALLIAWLLGIFTYVLVIMVMVALLRTFSGGAHCSSAVNCTVFGAIMMNLLGLFVKYFPLNRELGFTSMLLTFLFSLWAICIYAPADTPGKPITTKVKREKLRKRSLITICIWYAVVLGWFSVTDQFNLMMNLTFIGVLWQSFTLTKSGYHFCHLADKILKKIIQTRSGVTC